MRLPYERTRAVVQTREFLAELSRHSPALSRPTSVPPPGNSTAAAGPWSSTHSSPTTER
ncbi:MAG: BPSL0761 family protein [Pseudomonas sp.]